MFGLGFLNSIFLGALAATALPILIHILNRRRLRKVDFSSLEFIFELSRRRMSKVNFRRWIILALRTLAVLLIVIAFARPTLQSNAALFLPGKAPKHVIICMDASSSMHVERETGTAFSHAQQLARNVVDESGGNDLFNVVAFGSRTDILFENGTRNKQTVKNVVDGLSATYERGSLQKAVETAVTYMAKSELISGEIYVISDFRETTDSVVVSDTPDGIRVILLPVYEAPVANISIDRVFTPRKLIRPGEVVRVGVAVTNHSRQDPANFPLELYVGGKRKAEKMVSLSAAATANVSFSVSLNDWGRYPCKVSKNRDRLPIDDDRFFLLEVSQKIPVTLIRGKKYIEGTRQAAAYFYVDKALNPRGSGEGEFSVDVIDEKNLTAAALHSKGVVVWTEPQNLSRRRVELLKRFVEDGGALMVFLGSDRKGMWQDAEFARYLGIQKAIVREREDGERLASFQTDHPVFSIFNEEELELLSRSRMRRYLSVTGVSPDSVVAYLGSGDPGVWECRRGGGRILVVAATPDMPSGDLPLSPMFLPFVHTAVSYLASAESGEAHRENLAGADLFFDLPPQWSTQGGPLRVVSDGGAESQAILFDSPRGGSKAMITRPSDIGFYRLHADTVVVAEAAVNVDTEESNLNPQELESTFLGSARVVDTSSDFAGNLRREKQGREVYGLFLLLALGALVLESVLGRTA
jgi:hypothetical protein